MMHAHDLTLTPLPRRALLSLAGGTGRAVGVFSGSVWITEEGVLEDHVLAAGESLVLRRPGLVLVEGLQDSQLILFETDGSHGSHGSPSGVAAAGDGRTGAPGAAGTGRPAGAAVAARLNVVECERLARALRRQAIADAVSWLARAVAGAFKRPATPPPALPRPGPALAWQARR